MSISSRRPAILYVIDGLEFGGGERVFAQLARELAPFYRIVVAANPGGVFEQHIRHSKVDFLGIDLASRFSFKPVFQISRAIRKHRVDILHSQGARADFFCRLAGRLAGTAHILCTVAMPVEGFDVNRLKRMIYRLADKATETSVEHFIVVSEALQKLIVEKRGIDGRRVVRIYNGIELDHYTPGNAGSDWTETTSVSPDEVLIGCFGRLVWQKGIKYLLQALAAVAATDEHIRLVIVGDGPDRAGLEKLAAEISISDRVVFTGFVDDVRPWLSRVDIVAVPSVKEGFPMITLEAMAMAKPIVATRIEGIEEQLSHNQSALLVPPRSPAALSDALATVLANKQLAEDLGKQARHSVEKNFSLENTIIATKRLYDNLSGTDD